MDPIHLMAVFIVVGEEECLAAAARRLDQSPAAVRRAVSALEAHLNVALLSRMTRSVVLTEAGRRHLQVAKRIMSSLAAADTAVRAANADCRGRLSVTAPVEFGRTFVLPCLAEYMHRFPELQVAASFADRVVNLVDEGLDVAVRIGAVPDSGLKSLAVGKLRQVMCASPHYLATRGVPSVPADLGRHMLISCSAAHAGLDAVTWAHDIAPAKGSRARVTVTGAGAAIDAAVAGMGIARAMWYQVASRVADGSLEIVLAGHEPAALPVRVLHRQSRYGSAKVRNFIDLLVARLRAEPGLH